MQRNTNIYGTERNAVAFTGNWRFTLEDARAKLRRYICSRP